MLTELEPWLWIGAEEDCGLALATQRVHDSWGGIVHACKWPCHAKEVGYGYETRVALAKTHPEYLCAERPGNLYLNIIDPPVPLFQVEVFTRALDFIWQHIGGREQRVLIHCNKAESRAPSIALLFLVRACLLPNDSYQVAREAFLTKYPAYRPGPGIVTFLTDHWKEVT